MGDFIGVPITPQLWLDKEAQEAAELYCSVFQDSKITSTTTILIKERERNARYRPSCPRVALPSPVWQTVWLDSGQVRRLLADLPSVLDLDAGQGHARASGPRLANVSENEKDVPCAITKAYKGESLG